MNILREFWFFIQKQAYSALFGGLMLFFLVLSRYVAIPGIYRYDWLFIIAVLIQIILIVTKLEHPREVAAILVFHFFAMIMEVYKTSPQVGSWQYPEPAVLAIATVPLFTGFMYSSVGSYIARSWRINKFRFVNLPKQSILALFALVIYVNFFTNYFTQDMRLPIFILLIIAFWKAKFYATLTTKTFQIHPLVSNALLALFVWFAEQIGTLAQAWIYPNQHEGWKPVSFHMLTSWYMLLVFSFIIIALIYGSRQESSRTND